MRKFIGAGLALLAAPCYAQSTATVVVDPGAIGPLISNQILGMNMANWVDQTQAGLGAAMKSVSIKAVRWPGGSASDAYHWQSNSECEGGYVNQNATFDQFVTRVIQPEHLSVAVTLNYGSNATCNGGGDPAEAAAWVSYAKSQGYAVSQWTIGNEVYGSWEYDLHAAPHDAATYAAAVATGFYPAIKTANRSAQVGAVVAPDWSPAWDPIVLAQAKYDFVEYHYYAQEPGSESDTYLVSQAAQDFANSLTALKSELQTAGRADTPIYVGELGSVSYDPGKQTSSITQALFAGQALGEMMNAGITRATWWVWFGGCADANSGNFSSSLYGWQNFGGYMVFSYGTPEYGCNAATATTLGTKLPTARAFQLFSLVARNGEHALGVILGGSSGLLRAYAATRAGGTALVLFNLDEANQLFVSVAVKGGVSATTVLTNTYDRAIYDRSAGNIWAAPKESSAGSNALPLLVTLQPWSMTVLRLAP